MEYKYTAIVLGKKEIGETNRLYFLYTLEKGKISALATGVRKSTAKLAGSLENFMLIDLGLAKSRGMGKIIGSVVEEGYWNLRKNGWALESVFAALQKADKIIGPGENDQEVFNLLVQYLQTMDSLAQTNEQGREKYELISQGFLCKLLAQEGYLLEVGKCSLCAGPLEVKNLYFSSQQGGVLCGDCARREKNVLAMEQNAVKLFRIFFANKLNALCKLAVDKKTLLNLNYAVDDFLRWVG